MAVQPNSYPRFTLAQRLEHWVMSISFTVLMITGLVQRYALTNWAEFSIASMGGIEQVRIIHRAAAIIFMLVLIYHFVVVAYKVLVLRVRLTMIPTWQDVWNFVDTIRYYLRQARDYPQMPRYNYAEKMEYWAVVWGGVLMTITGFMLWNPIATTNFLPGEAIPAARAAHSAEALLAFLAIIIWHFYWVHFKHFNRAMFSGRLSREQMEIEHGAELAAIESGQLPPPPPQELVRRRIQVFIPVAAVITVLLLVGLYYFVTFEETAITTIPRMETAEAFVPATPTPTLPPPAPTPTGLPSLAGGEILLFTASMIPHPIEGQEECQSCHGPEGPLPYPENHDQFDLSMCQVCHSLQSPKPAPPPISHSLIEREQCTSCHALDLQPESHQEVDFNDRTCLVCHIVVE
jgi:formate dehydrogenase gamma subunit